MSTLTPIGNSQGIRIPKPLIKQAKLEDCELELIVVPSGLLIKPLKNRRETWASDIQDVMLKYGDKKDKALLSDLLDDSDLEDWSW
jgi:antitoxin MazE